MSGKVTSLHGGPTYEKEPSPACIEVLEELLAQAKAGEIVGIATAAMTHDGCGEWRIGGRVGGYSMLGAADVMRAEIVDVVRGDT